MRQFTHVEPVLYCPEPQEHAVPPVSCVAPVPQFAHAEAPVIDEYFADGQLTHAEAYSEVENIPAAQLVQVVDPGDPE